MHSSRSTFATTWKSRGIRSGPLLFFPLSSTPERQSGLFAILDVPRSTRNPHHWNLIALLLRLVDRQGR